jgi:peptidoglycan/xylan/chitin deacetylase (PgdA/CDA1 family)
MKIRYFCVTLLFLGLFVYGAAALLEQMRRHALPAAGDTAGALVEPPAEPAAAETPAPANDAAPVTAAAPAQPEPAAAPPFTVTPEDIARVQQRYATAAPTQWGEHTRGVVRRVDLPAGDSAARTLFLTLNVYHGDGDALPAFLSEGGIRATVFVSGQYAARHAAALQRLAQDTLFDIGCLGDRGRPLSVSGDSAYRIRGTASLRGALQEVTEGARKIHAATGTFPALLRSATGYIDDVAARALTDLGFRVIGYAQVTDEGGQLSVAAVKARILAARHGDILVIGLNRNYPNGLLGLRAAVEEIQARRLPVRFAKLAEYPSSFETNR